MFKSLFLVFLATMGISSICSVYVFDDFESYFFLKGSGIFPAMRAFGHYRGVEFYEFQYFVSIQFQDGSSEQIALGNSYIDKMGTHNLVSSTYIVIVLSAPIWGTMPRANISRMLANSFCKESLLTQVLEIVKPVSSISLRVTSLTNLQKSFHVEAKCP